MDCISYLTSSLIPNKTGGIHLGYGSEEAGPVDLLALGSGWTWSFLGPAAGEKGLRTAFTTRNGGNGSIPFTFDPESDDMSSFETLPDAKTVVIIFALYTPEAIRRLINGYISTRSEEIQKPLMIKSSRAEQEKPQTFDSARTRFILLGSTGIWKGGGPTVQLAPLSQDLMTERAYVTGQEDSKDIIEEKKKPSPIASPWFDRNSKVDEVPRARAENELLAFNFAGKDAVPTSVLCLSGLWGHGRSLRRYIERIAPNKEQLSKLKSIHFVHGHDVARAILAMHDQWDKAVAKRWLLTNERVYDLWDLISQWGNAGEAGRDHFPQGMQPVWVQELIKESKNEKDPRARVRALPRSVEQLGYALDSSEFWSTFSLFPEVPWVD